MKKNRESFFIFIAAMLLGLLIGVILGFVLDVNISDKFSPYMSVAILACLDSVFGAIRANLS